MFLVQIYYFNNIGKGFVLFNFFNISEVSGRIGRKIFFYFPMLTSRMFNLFIGKLLLYCLFLDERGPREQKEQLGHKRNRYQSRVAASRSAANRHENRVPETRTARTDIGKNKSSVLSPLYNIEVLQYTMIEVRVTQHISK